MGVRPKIAGLALTWIAAVAVVAALMTLGRQEALNRAAEDTAAFSAVVAQLTERTVQALYQALSSVADTLEYIDPEKNDPEFRSLLERRLYDVPFARALFVIGEDGWIVHDTDYPTTPNLSLADRPYFQAYARDSDRAPTVWPPLLSRSGTGWFLPITTALNRSGDFKGVVVAALQADRFTEELLDAGLGTPHFVALFHDDGTMVASYPPRPDDVGRRFPDLPMLPEAVSDDAIAAGSFGSMVDGERIVSYRSVENAPLTVLVSTSKDDVLAGWRRVAAAAALAMIALTAFLVWQVAVFTHTQLQRERERQRQTQIEKLEALGQLTGGIAHDFSNVLQIVATNVKLLSMKRTDPSTAAQALESTERAIRNGTAMVERLLGIARRKPLTLTRLKLDEWLEAVRPLLAQAAGSGIRLEIDVENVPEVLCDSDELDMSLVNLVVNARHATSGNGRVTIRVHPCDTRTSGLPRRLFATPARFVCLSVIDNGCGMTEAVKRRCIEPFFSTKKAEGTGLGLSQVYGFMQQIGGSLTIESSPGRGTAVHLFIPVASDRQD